MCKSIKLVICIVLLFFILNVGVILGEFNNVNIVKAAIVNQKPIAVTIDGIEACSHTYRWEITKEATCTREGSMDWKCSKCSNKERTNIISALGHDFSEATCVSARKCKRCNETNGSSLGHDYIYTKVDTLNHRITCSRCEYNSTTSHIFIDTKCKFCKYIKIEEVAIDICNHTYSWEITKEATCAMEGSMDWKCSKCSNIERTNAISSLGHDFSEATCIAASKCRRCNVIDGVDLGHDFVEATCISARKCRRCNETNGSSLGHDYIYTKVDTLNHRITCSRCDYNSTTSHIFIDTKCKFCKYIKMEEVAIDICNHTYSWVTTKLATCTTEGSVELKCSKCSNVEKTDIVAALGHKFSKATCSVPSKCVICNVVNGSPRGHEYEYTKIDEKNHEMICLKCSVKSTEIHRFEDDKCKNCKYIKEIIEEDCKHTYKWVITKDASCTDIGIKVNKCTKCEEILEEDTIIALGHDYSKATCERVATCNICGDEKGYLLEHNLIGKKKDELYHTVKCEECGYKAADEEHVFALGVCIGCKYKIKCSDRYSVITHTIQIKEYSKLSEQNHNAIYKCKECNVLIKKEEPHKFTSDGICEKCEFKDETKAKDTTYMYLNGFAGTQVTAVDGFSSGKNEKIKYDDVIAQMKEADEVDLTVFSAGVANLPVVIEAYKDACKDNPKHIRIRLAEVSFMEIGGNRSNPDGLIKLLESIPEEYREYVDVEFRVGEKNRDENKYVYQTTIDAYANLYEKTDDLDYANFGSVEIYGINQDEVTTSDKRVYDCNNMSYDEGKGNPHEELQVAIVKELKTDELIISKK